MILSRCYYKTSVEIANTTERTSDKQIGKISFLSVVKNAKLKIISQNVNNIKLKV